MIILINLFVSVTGVEKPVFGRLKFQPTLVDFVSTKKNVHESRMTPDPDLVFENELPFYGRDGCIGIGGFYLFSNNLSLNLAEVYCFYFVLLMSVKCFKRTKNEEKRLGMVRLKKSLELQAHVNIWTLGTVLKHPCPVSALYCYLFFHCCFDSRSQNFRVTMKIE